MKNIILITTVLSVLSQNVYAITCQAMRYSDQSELSTVSITQSIQTVYQQNGYKYKVIIQSDGRYTIALIKPNGTAMGAMGLQNGELTLADEEQDLTIACK